MIELCVIFWYGMRQCWLEIAKSIPPNVVAKKLLKEKIADKRLTDRFVTMEYRRFRNTHHRDWDEKNDLLMVLVCERPHLREKWEKS